MSHEVIQRDRENAVKHLNNANLPGNSKIRVDELKQVEELVLHKSKPLLPEFLPLILEMQSDRAAAVKKFVVDFVLKACKADVEHIPVILPNLVQFLHDEKASVVKAATGVAQFVLEPSLLLLCQKFGAGQMDGMKDLWKSITHIKSSMRDLTDSKNEGVRSSAIKCLEVMIRLFSYPARPSSVATKHFSLHLVQPEHPLLNAKAMEGEAVEILKEMIQRAKSLDTLTLTNIGAVINSLHRLARQRKQFSSLIIQFMIDFEEVFHSKLETDGKCASVKTNLKQCLLSMLKYREFSHHREAITKVLIKMGFEEEIPRLPAVQIASSSSSSSSNGSGANKNRKRERPRQLEKAAEDEKQVLIDRASSSSSSRRPTANKSPLTAPLTRSQYPNIDPTIERREELDVLLNFPNRYIVQLVLSCIKKYKTNKSVPLITTENSALVGLIKKLGVVATPKDLPQLSSSKRHNIPEIPVPILSSSRCSKLSKRAFLRLISQRTEEALQREGKLDLRASVLAKLATYSHGSKVVDSQLTKYLLEDLPKRYDIAIRWLYSLLASDESSERYGEIVGIFMSHILSLEPDETSEIFCKYVVDIPELPKTVLQTVQECCSDPEQIVLGLTVLTDIILLRPNDRDVSLSILLTYARDEDNDLRSEAVRQVLNKLYTESCLQKKIENTANEYLMNILLPPQVIKSEQDPAIKIEKGLEPSREPGGRSMDLTDDSTDGKTDNPENRKAKIELLYNHVKRHIALHKALCVQKFTLIGDVMNIYIKADSDTKKIILKQTKDLIEKIGMDSQEILKLIESCKAGGEAFVLHVLAVLTNKTAPSEALIKAVKSLYFNRVQDARFLIHILVGLKPEEINQLLPKLVSLPVDNPKQAIDKILSMDSIEPADLLVRLHGLCPRKGHHLLRKVIDVIQYCFGKRKIFNREVLAVVLQQQVDMNPVPVLFMRTLIQTLLVCPTLTNFAMGILSRLVSKRVWESPDLWEGFIRCCKMTRPNSLSVLLQLPSAQLEHIVKGSPDLLIPLREHAKSKGLSVQRQILVVLGLAKDEPESKEKEKSKSSRKKSKTSKDKKSKTPKSSDKHKSKKSGRKHKDKSKAKERSKKRRRKE